MATPSCLASFALLLILSSGFSQDPSVIIDKEAPEAVLADGGTVFTPPPSPPQPPLPTPLAAARCGFETDLIARAYPVIQSFKKKITRDPFNYTNTWVGNDVCSYRGFICSLRPDKQKKAVAGIDFNGARLDGDLSLEGFLDQLQDVAIFHANSNNFTGLIPKGIASLPYLYELDISNNKLSGSFPVEILRAKSLSFLDLRFNQLCGTVPAQVFNLKLDLSFLNNNQFTQTLPNNLGDTTALYLTFTSNKFTGPIPKSIGKAKNLLEVLFTDNRLTGCLPYEIGFLRNATLFDVASNLLTGPIPHSFGCFTKMEILNLANNQFYGSVPEILCKVPTLLNVSLARNYFTEVGAACRNLIARGVLNVAMNCILDLPNQRSSGECTAFFSQPRSCPFPKLLNMVPCKIAERYYSKAFIGNNSIAAAPPSPVTYAALVPDGLHRRHRL